MYTSIKKIENNEVLNYILNGEHRDQTKRMRRTDLKIWEYKNDGPK